MSTAFRWLLFNKDSQDRKDFEIKTIGSDGKVFHGLEHKVEAVLNISGDEVDFMSVKLTKVYKEIWRKKKQVEGKVFSGHTSDYFIDGVPTSKKDYDKYLDDIIPESTFKIITDPLYFSESLHWKEQRGILLDVTGDISQEEVLSANSKLAKLDLQGKTIDDFRKMVKAKRRKLNEEIGKIPVRIDEVNKGKRDEDFGELEKEKAESLAELKTLQDYLNNRKENPEKKKLLQEISRLQNEIMEKQSMYELNFNKEKFELKNKLKTLNQTAIQKREEAKNLREMVKLRADENLRLEQNMINLRREWEEVNAEQFKAEVDNTCPVCHQKLPEEDVANKLREMEKDFNVDKAEKLEAINKKGKQASETKFKNELFIGENNDEAIKNEEQAAGIMQQLTLLDDTIKTMKLGEPDDVTGLKKLLKTRQDALEELKEDKIDEEKRFKAELDAKLLRVEIEELDSRLAYKDVNRKADERIAELKQQQKELAQQIASIEKQEFLSDEFVKTKVALLEERINNKFKNVSFRLFETQVDGSLIEVCKPLVNGIPFSDANRAGQVNSGLDIINTLTEYYGVSAPIWIDERESITNIIKTKSQVINLIVDENYKELTVMGEGE